ncbi:MAG: hypothetical protein ABFD15_01300 [Methanofastidiosum sp.]
MFGIPLIIIISSIFIGIYFPSYGKEISPIVPILQSILIFLSTIKVDFKIYKKYMSLLKPFLLGFFTCYIFIPVLFFLVGLFLLKINIINFPLFVGMIITGTVPLAAGSTLVWSKELGGKVEITLLLIVTTILASPLITPTYIYLFLRNEISVNATRMFIEMAPIIFIPVFISVLVRKKFTINLNSNLSFFVMGIIIYIAVSKSVERLDIVKDYLFVSIILSLSFIIITLLFMAIFSNILKLKIEEKESIFIPSFFKNISLAIIVVSFFEPEVVFFPVVYYIIEQLVSPLYYEIKKYNINR